MVFFLHLASIARSEELEHPGGGTSRWSLRVGSEIGAHLPKGFPESDFESRVFARQWEVNGFALRPLLPHQLGISLRQVETSDQAIIVFVPGVRLELFGQRHLL